MHIKNWSLIAEPKVNSIRYRSSQKAGVLFLSDRSPNQEHGLWLSLNLVMLEIF
jgi:hypothetical protein